MSEDAAPSGFTMQVTAIVTGTANHPDLETLSRDQCAHLGINEETDE